MTRATGWASPILGQPSDGDFECSGDVKYASENLLRRMCGNFVYNCEQWGVCQAEISLTGGCHEAQPPPLANPSLQSTRTRLLNLLMR